MSTHDDTKTRTSQAWAIPAFALFNLALCVAYVTGNGATSEGPFAGPLAVGSLLGVVAVTVAVAWFTYRLMRPNRRSRGAGRG